METTKIREQEVQTEQVETTTPPAPQRPNPFRREQDGTQVIPDLEPQG
jgi:hypothetical protein